MRLLWESDSLEKNNLTVQEWNKFYIELIVLFMSFLPLQIRNSFEYWAALPELVYRAQKKIVITNWSEMAQDEGPEPV